ncbi:NAD(P)-binding domain-containing protein [Nocardiopsis sp. ARC36]
MSVQEIEVVVVGGGQAGIAVSEHLNEHKVPHVVLERNRVAERWRSERWDSLVTNGPVWHDRFPGLEFTGLGPEDFASKEQVADYLAAYAEKIGAPIRCGVEVTSVRRHTGRRGFRVRTSDGDFDARYVVAATGPFQRPAVPPIIPEEAGLVQIHSSAYRNPAQLPEGAVLVVGSGSSGVQIADELRAAGRRVHLSVGPHDRPRAGTADTTSSGGWACSASGRRPPLRRAPNTSRSRSVARTAAAPWTSGRWPTAASPWSAGPSPSTPGPSASRPTCGTTSRGVTPTTCPCWTRPTPTSSATASTSPRSRRPGSWAMTRSR